jgi:ATP-dependent DNA ligase
LADGLIQRAVARGLGSLLLGVHNADGALVYAGKVGTGFNDRSLRELHDKLKNLATDKRPFKGPTPGERHVHWVKPKLIAEVSFSEWTRDGHLRHPVFHALRTDKPARANHPGRADKPGGLRIPRDRHRELPRVSSSPIRIG